MTQTEKDIYKKVIKYLKKIIEDGTRESLSDYNEDDHFYNDELRTVIKLKIVVNHDVIKGDD